MRAREEPLGVGSDDEVRLAVPARPEFVGLARVTAAGLASRLGFTSAKVKTASSNCVSCSALKA